MGKTGNLSINSENIFPIIKYVIYNNGSITTNPTNSFKNNLSTYSTINTVNANINEFESANI